MDDMLGKTIVDLQRMVWDFESEIEEPTGSPSIRELNFYIDTLKHSIHLLKTQEPVLLENQHKPGGHFINANSPWISRCPKCGRKIEGKQTRFCKYCGQAVKWE